MDPFLKKISKYQYPTIEELSKLNDDKKAPNLHRFGFEDQWNNVQIQENLIKGNINQYHRLNHLYEWDQQLADKIIDLQTAYVYLLVHFRRGIPKTTNEYIKNTSIQPNYENLKFYLTYLHYIIVSIIDNILQIINLFFDLGFKEYQISKGEIIKKLRKRNFDKVADEIKEFYDDFARYSNFRNALAHRFSPLSIDRRSVIEDNSPYKKITLEGNNKFPDFEAEISSVQDSFDHLRFFMEKLKNILFSIKI